MTFDFDFQLNITADDILSSVSEEAIFCHYMGISSIEKKLYRSVIREDNHPTCSFFRKSKLYLKDFATGDCLNCFSLVMKIYNCDYYTALKHIANDMGIKSYNVDCQRTVKAVKRFEEKAGPTILQVEVQPFSKSELNWWEQFGITAKTLKQYNVYSCKYIFLNGNVIAKSTQTNPIYGYYFGKKNGIELWKIYRPMNRGRGQIRFMNNLDAKRLQGFKQLPEKGPVLVVTKSMKDCMALSEFGIPACAPNSEHLFLTDKQLEDFKARFKHIIVMYDNDRTGLAQMAKLRRQYPELNYVFIPKQTNSKDFSDFYRDHGKQQTMRLLRQYFNYLKQK